MFLCRNRMIVTGSNSGRPIDSDRTREALLEFFASEPTEYPLYEAGPMSSVYLEVPKLERELQGYDPPELVDEHIRDSIELVESREDCGDFVLPALLRILYRYPESDLLSRELRTGIEEAALGFIYWFDEPGKQDMWMTSENHQILFHTSELLAGQLFPDRTFTNNGKDGTWHREHAEEYVRRWLEGRIRFGYSEWNSNCYFDEDLVALVNLAEYAADDSIREQSEQLLHLTLFQMALSTFRGTFGSTHGRSYARLVLNPPRESTHPLCYLFWGEGSYEHALSRSAVLLAASEYRVPPVVQAVALDDRDEMETRERHGFDVEDGPRYGIDPTDPDHVMLFNNRSHRDVIQTWFDECPVNYHLGYPKRAHEYHRTQAGTDGYDPDPSPSALTEANLYTYRTPEYMLSCAQDYRSGKHGFQQHIWQATLGNDAVVYTSHPGAEDIGSSRPDYWMGNGVQPRAAAHRNVVVSLYRFDRDDTSTYPGHPDEQLPYTHGFFPRERFDEWTENEEWVCGRTGEGYIALRSLEPARWAEPRDADVDVLRPPDAGADWRPAPYERIADGCENAWICELGNPRSHGSFDEFVRGVTEAELAGDVSELRYDSPSLGTVEFGWESELRVDDATVSVDEHPRFHNPYCVANFDTTTYDVRHEGRELRLDFDI